MRSNLSFRLLQTKLSLRGSASKALEVNATPWENEERNVCLLECGRQSAISHHFSQLGGGFNSPTSPWAAKRSFHSSHLYSIYVSMVGCLVLLNTHFVNVSFYVLIRLLQNPTRRLPKMSHVCRQGCLQDVSAQRCRAVQETWEKTTLAQHKSLFIRENALVEQRGPSRSTPGGNPLASR